MDTLVRSFLPGGTGFRGGSKNQSEIPFDPSRRPFRNMARFRLDTHPATPDAKKARMLGL